MKNRYEIRDGYAVLFLKRKSGRLIESCIDIPDLNKILPMNVTWFFGDKAKNRNSGTFYVRTNIYPNGKRICLPLHRVILNAKKGQVVDHIDGNGLNNRRGNLRITSHTGNCVHKIGLASNNTSGYRGVYWHNRAKKWTVQIMIYGRKINLGYYTDKQLAIKAAEKGIRSHPEYLKASIV